MVTVDAQGTCTKAGVGITGAGTKAVRAKGVEAGLVGKRLDAATIEAAAQKAAEGVDVQADLQGGYVFPFADVDRLHGFRAQASIRFHMW